MCAYDVALILKYLKSLLSEQSMVPSWSFLQTFEVCSTVDIRLCSAQARAVGSII